MRDLVCGHCLSEKQHVWLLHADAMEREQLLEMDAWMNSWNVTGNIIPRNILLVTTSTCDIHLTPFTLFVPFILLRRAQRGQRTH